MQIWLILSGGQLVQNLESPDRILHPIGSRGTKLIRIISRTEPNQSLNLLIGFLRFLRTKKVTFSKGWSYLSNPKCFNFCLFCSVLLYKIYIQYFSKYFEILFFFFNYYKILKFFWYDMLFFDSMSIPFAFNLLSPTIVFWFNVHFHLLLYPRINSC